MNRPNAHQSKVTVHRKKYVILTDEEAYNSVLVMAAGTLSMQDLFEMIVDASWDSNIYHQPILFDLRRAELAINDQEFARLIRYHPGLQGQNGNRCAMTFVVGDSIPEKLIEVGKKEIEEAGGTVSIFNNIQLAVEWCEANLPGF